MTAQLPGAVEILESMDEAFYAVDRDWRFMYINSGAERFWQCQCEKGFSLFDPLNTLLNTQDDNTTATGGKASGS